MGVSGIKAKVNKQSTSSSEGKGFKFGFIPKRTPTFHQILQNYDIDS